MNFLVAKIRKLQSQPYETRLRIFKTAVGIVILLVIIFWIISLQFRPKMENGWGDKFSNLMDKFNTGIQAIKNR